MREFAWSVLVILICAVKLSAQSQEQAWKKLEVLVAEAGGRVGFSVRNAEGQTVNAWNDRQNFIPASSLKLLTALAFRKLAGENHQFQTGLYHTGIIENGVLHGDLLIVGGGDPSLLSKYFPEQNPVDFWIDAIQRMGIKEIRGSVVGLDNYFAGYPLAFGVSLEDAGNYYGCGAWGLNAFDNAVPVFLSSGEPGKPFQIIESRDLSGASYKTVGSGELQTNDQAYVIGTPEQFGRTIEGTIPANRNSFQIQASMPDPALYLARHVMQELEQEGIAVSRPAWSHRDTVSGLVRVAEPYLSANTEALCEVMLRESHNLIADALFRELSKLKGLDGRFLTAAEVFKTLCGLPERTQLMDGSGLSRTNLICPYDFSMALHGFSSEKGFVPPPGLKKEVLSNGAELYLKTGSMGGVRALSGFARSKEGSWQSFSLMANAFIGDGAAIRRQMFAFVRTYFGAE